MKLFLCGYMGSGKSVLAQSLTEKLSFPHIDLDDQIALIEGKSVPEIFKTKGELYFRKRETQVLGDILEDPSSIIIALGGGTPCYGFNLDLIKNTPDAKMIYLKASVGFLTNRLFSELGTRPVISHLAKKEELEDFVRKHLFERSYYYNQADLKINVEGRSPEDIADEIIQKLE